MRMTAKVLAVTGLTASSLLAFPRPAHGEVIEEIVAWVNGDIITSSELKDEEQAAISDAYRNYTGDELDRQVEQVRRDLLMRMIDRKLLLQKAKTMFDTEKMSDVFYEGFKERYGYKDDQALQDDLKHEGMTIDELKKRLLAMSAPDEVLRYEVGNRVAVSDKELEAYYAEHSQRFVVPAEVTIREIVLLADTDEKKKLRRAEVEEIRQRAISGDFAALASEVSEAGTASKGGLLGPLKRGELAKPIEDAAFSLPVGEVSEPIVLGHGFHIIKVESRTEEHLKPLDDVREDLRNWLEDRKYAEQTKAFLDKLREEADWCVKAKFEDRLPPGQKAPSCQSL